MPFGIGVVWYPKNRRVELTARELRLRRKRLPMEKVNLLHVARLWLEGRSTADDQPVAKWTRFDRVVRVPLLDGRVFGPWSSVARPLSPRCSAPSRSRRAAGPTSNRHLPWPPTPA
ncbi:hypothetical protein ACWD1Z_36800 [Streptomyces sp. NPDC002784]